MRCLGPRPAPRNGARGSAATLALLALGMLGMLGMLGILGTACTSGAEPPGSAASEPIGPLVATTAGKLEGQWVDASEDVLVFRGVPYAKPPVGELRFRPPQPPEPWQGTRAAREAGLPCWQPITPETSIYSRGEMELGEDCLDLNLWTPAKAPQDRLPVMVWFHGGGHSTGHGSSLVFDGTALARKGVVLVSANYRLGPLGFLAHPALTAESPQGSSGNYGILDKIAVLEWVRDNAAAFGGDPTNVTIFGQSAGSASVCTLIASPLAAGLFQKAIGHSASCLAPRPTLDDGHARGLALAKALGIEGEGPEAAAALREAAPDALLAASGTPEAASPGILVDGWVVPRQMGEIYAAGEQNHVPTIVGWLADEGKGLWSTMPERTRAEVEAWVGESSGAQAEAVLAAYAEEIAASPRSAQAAIQTDRFFGWGARAWARETARAGTPAYLYFFTQAPPVYLLYLPDRPPLEIPEGPRGYGAYHSGDLAYAFANLHLVGTGWDDTDREVSRAMSQYWVNFARTGDPNGEGLPEWPRYDPSTDESLELGAHIGAVSFVRKQKLDIYDAMLANGR